MKKWQPPITLLLFVFFISSPIFANNLKITGGRAANYLANTVDLTLNISQENTISTMTAQAVPEPVKDCAWLFIKFSTNGQAGPWNHATITAQSAGDASGASIYNTSDRKGVYLFANTNAKYWASSGVKVRWNFNADGIGAFTSAVSYRAMAMEMVYISTGSFIYDALGIGTT